MTLPVPRIDDETRAYWTGGRGGQLLIYRCSQCGYRSHPPTPRCGRCRSDRVGPEPVSGLGTVYSFTINRQRWTPSLAVPYVLAVVALQEQPDLRIFTNIIGISPDEVTIGMPVTVTFQARGDVLLPMFTPIAA